MFIFMFYLCFIYCYVQILENLVKEKTMRENGEHMEGRLDVQLTGIHRGIRTLASRTHLFDLGI